MRRENLNLNLNLKSYPPMFRSIQETDLNINHIEMENESELNPNLNLNLNLNLNSDEMPIIDMECLDEEKLEKASREWGIFRLVNHGVPTRLLEQLQEHAKKIFKLPYETKQDLGAKESNPLMKYFWGTPALTPAGVALPRASGPQNVDWVEGFNVPLSLLSSSHHHHRRHHDHLLIDDFSQLLKEYGRHLARLSLTLFEAMMKKLKVKNEVHVHLKEHTNASALYVDETTGLIRVYRYPPRTTTSIEDDYVYGMHVHTDSSVLSILNEDQIGGLHFLKNDIWFNVNPVPNTLVVNLGDMMQALSDDEYKSVKHKVTLNKHKERMSICYFVFPNENTLIQNSKYKPFTYSDFRDQVQRDVKTIGSKIGLDRFRIIPLATS